MHQTTSKQKLFILTTIILLPPILGLYFFPYLSYRLLTEYKIHPRYLYIDQTNKISPKYWHKLDKLTFKYYSRPAATASDVEIYRVEDKDTVILLEFNPGDGCGTMIFDQVLAPRKLRYDENTQTYTDTYQTYLPKLCS